MEESTNQEGKGRSVLLTGATGFVGRAAYPALAAAGWKVRCSTRDAAAASSRWPGRDWVTADVGDRDSVARALEWAREVTSDRKRVNLFSVP